MAAYLTFAAALACKGGELVLTRRAVKIAPSEGGPAIDRYARNVAICAGVGTLWAASRVGINLGNWYRYSGSNMGALFPELATLWGAVMSVSQTQGDNMVIKMYRDALDADAAAAEHAG